jgi:hypothetical protein
MPFRELERQFFAYDPAGKAYSDGRADSASYCADTHVGGAAQNDSRCQADRYAVPEAAFEVANLNR